MDRDMEQDIVMNREQEAAAAPALRFDELLRDKAIQSEFDRRVSRALETARSKWAQDTERRLEQARAEAEKLARMSGEERMAHELAGREAELNEREAALKKRELRAEALRMIRERSLPAELAEALDYESPERVAESLDAAERAFRSAVQQGVEMRLRGSVPAAAGTNRGGEVSDSEYYRSHFSGI